MNLRTRGFLECEGAPGAPFSLLGLPFDGTCSFRPGARFGPAAIREASWVLETYSPALDEELDGSLVADLGDLDLAPRDPWGPIERAAERLLAGGHRILALGGEHSVTPPLVRAHARRHPGLVLVHFDAHADLREEYLGDPRSHACAVRRCLDSVPPERLVQLGIRSGTREEFRWMRTHETLGAATPEGVREALSRTTGPIYLTVDVDVFDPCVVPGTGTPEPGGLGYREFEDCLREIGRTGRPVVGADVVELSPGWDPTGASAVVAAKVVREILLLMGATR